jgi:hypothetical protein
MSPFPDVNEGLGAPSYPEAGMDVLDATRSSEVSNLPRQLAQVNLTILNEWVYAGLAVVRTAGVYTKIRFATGATVTALTDVRAGVWNSSGVKLGETAESHAIVTSAVKTYELALLEAVKITLGQRVYLGVGGVGTTLTTCGINFVSSTVIGGSPSLFASKSGWKTGEVLPNLTVPNNQGHYPWVELLP